MPVDVSRPLSQAEIDELGDFLMSDETPEECMDISMLDGFLTAVVIGPENMMPSRWFPIVYGETENDEMVWESAEKMQRILELIMRLYNSISQAFQADPPEFAPLLAINTVAGKEYTVLDEWCAGFMAAIGLDPESWLPLYEQKELKAPIFPIYLHGSEEGWKALEEDPKLSKVPHEEWVAMLPAAVKEIHQFWLPVRQAEMQILESTVSAKYGRNDPCPCGSGKKYKKCHGAPRASD